MTRRTDATRSPALVAARDRVRRGVGGLIVAALLAPGIAAAAPPEAAGPVPSPAPEDVATAARAAFQKGTRLVAAAQWAEALASFEEAQRTLPHAITLYNIGACERALGRYTAARETLERALVEHEGGATRLPETLVDDARAFLTEIAGLVAEVEVRVKPAEAALAVDGRATSPARGQQGLLPRLVAGIRPPGGGERLPASHFVLQLDPGRHVLVFSRPGASDAVIARDFVAGRNPPLDLALDDLPATLIVQAEPAGAIVTVDGRDVGPVPVTLLRPAGLYEVVVEKDGFITAETKLALKAGDVTRYRATLPVDEPSVLETWWFWTVAGVAVTGVAVGTYFAARNEPPPERATVGGGSLGWRVPVP